MDPSVLDLTESKDNTLSFTISNINCSLANALRRVILANIPTVVFRTFPHEKNDATFHINTSRLNNEILKQRLSCIPIHISDMDIDLNDYLMELDVKNTGETTIFVTSGDFKIFNTATNKYLSDDILSTIFPPDPISNRFIDLCRLRPKISDNIPGEHLKLSCKFSKGTAAENGSFNVVSTCSYGNTPDPIKIEEAKALKLVELREKYEDETIIKSELDDWLNLDAKRLFVPDSFNFKIETLGVFTNKSIVLKAINIIIERLEKITSIYSSQNSLIVNSDTTVPNSFDIILENEDYTIGKILEYFLYTTYYLSTQSLTFCGFRKPHPHINKSIIRIAFKEQSEKNTVAEYLVSAVDLAITFYKKLPLQFGEIISEEKVISSMPSKKSTKVPTKSKIATKLKVSSKSASAAPPATASAAPSASAAPPGTAGTVMEPVEESPVESEKE